MKKFFSFFCIYLLLTTLVYAEEASLNKEETNPVQIQSQDSNQINKEENSMDSMLDDIKKMRQKMSKFMEKMQDVIQEETSLKISKEDNKTDFDQDFDIAFDIKETNDNIIISYDLPGMEKDKIDIIVKDNTLTVSGKREEIKKEQIKQDGKIMHKTNKKYGAFSKTVRLPEGVDSNVIKAEYLNGVLVIKIKYKKPEIKKIQVQ